MPFARFTNKPISSNDSFYWLEQQDELADHIKNMSESVWPHQPRNSMLLLSEYRPLVPIPHNIINFLSGMKRHLLFIVSLSISVISRFWL